MDGALSEDPEKRPSGAKQAAEKLRRVGKSPEKRPTGAKSSVDFKATYGTTKVVPFQNSPLMGVFPQPVKSCPDASRPAETFLPQVFIHWPGRGETP
jgi:hypothetical protein